MNSWAAWPELGPECAVVTGLAPAPYLPPPSPPPRPEEPVPSRSIKSKVYELYFCKLIFVLIGTYWDSFAVKSLSH